MFGTIYSKAVELFGKAFLVSAFIPALIVSAGLTAMVAPEWFRSTLAAWTGAQFNTQVAGALLVLLALYLVAFIIFGIRDRITRFLSAGQFWGFSALRRLRRIHYTQAFLDAQEAERGAAKAVGQATTWALAGFPLDPFDKKYVYLPKKLTAKRVFAELHRWMKILDRRELNEELTAAERVEFAGLFLALHRGAAFDVERTRLVVAHLRELPINIKKWSAQVQQLDYADLVAAFDRTLWSPPPRNIQPTALGNILIWAAVYSAQRYGIELEFLFPRLLRVIDKDYQAKIDDRQQFLDFAVLLTFLSFAAGIAYAGFAIYDLATRPWTWRDLLTAIACTASWLILGRIAYSLSLVAARGYVSMITSAIDLFRLPLLEALKIALPDAAWKEFNIWSELNVTIQKGARPKPPAC
jgi:hypothetical protein